MFNVATLCPPDSGRCCSALEQLTPRWRLPRGESSRTGGSMLVLNLLRHSCRRAACRRSHCCGAYRSAAEPSFRRIRRERKESGAGRGKDVKCVYGEGENLPVRKCRLSRFDHPYCNHVAFALACLHSSVVFSFLFPCSFLLFSTVGMYIYVSWATYNLIFFATFLVRTQ